MIVYVVQEGDTITSIASKYRVSEKRLQQENFVSDPNNLAVGDTLVITYPKQIHIVKDGDTLISIAKDYNIPLMQLYRNNPHLWEDETLIVGQMIVISYQTKGETMTSGYVFSFVGKDILRMTLPYLTYLNIFNYTLAPKGGLVSVYDETDIITMTKQFGVQPLLLVSGLNFRGERSPELVYEILLNVDNQINQANRIVEIMQEKGYYGVNIVFTMLNERSQSLYIEFLKRVVPLINEAGFKVFITIDSEFSDEENGDKFERVDYSEFNNLIEGTFLRRFYWGTLYGPPRPVASIQDISEYLDYVKTMIEPKKLNIGFPLLGYLWTLPYIEGFTRANAYSISASINLANVTDTPILFDEVSKTPHFRYVNELPIETIDYEVWFVDARTINEIVTLAIDNKLQGTGLWNIMSYYPQIWLIINSTFKIIKLLPEE